MTDILSLLCSHRTIRHFRPDPLPEEHLRAAIAAGQRAATSSNVQGYTAIEIRDATLRRALRELCADQAQVEQAGAFLVVCADQRRHARVAARRGAPFEPNLESFLTCVIDAALFAQNLAVALEGQGYGTCFIGALRNRIAEVDRLLALPPHVYPLFGLCAGVPDEDPQPRPRLAVQAVWCVDRYPEEAELDAAIDEYDERMAKYYAERGAAGRDWSGGIVRKFAEPRRTELAGFYRSKGARLE